MLQEVLNLSELTEQIDTLRDNMTFIQDNINECQNSIVHMEEFKVKLFLLWFLVLSQIQVDEVKVVYLTLILIAYFSFLAWTCKETVGEH